jgi:hypothetical protein
VRHEGKTTSRPLSLDQRIEVAGSRYTFHLARFVPSGELVEEYLPAEGRGGVAALKIETADPSGTRVTTWLALNKQRVVTTGVGPMTVSFGPAQAGTPRPTMPAH